MKDLIARLEAATEGSRELDEAVSEFVFMETRITPFRRPYTTSLDAALTLVREGDEWSVTNLYGFAQAEVGLNDSDGSHTCRRKDDNVVLALCIACLKARA
jgi:hypothetical protein